MAALSSGLNKCAPFEPHLKAQSQRDSSAATDRFWRRHPAQEANTLHSGSVHTKLAHLRCEPSGRKRDVMEMHSVGGGAYTIAWHDYLLTPVRYCMLQLLEYLHTVCP